MRKIAATLLLVAACTGQEQDAADNLVTYNPEDRSGTPADRPAYVPPEASADRAPTAGAPESATSAQAAAVVLRDYFALAEAGDWNEAAELWWDDGRAAAFAAELRRFGDFRPSIAAPGRVEGAAGSAYVSISLQLLRGSRALSDGTAVLRRVNDVPGSTAAQRRWRIDRIMLQPPPQPIAYRFVGRWASEERHCANRAWVFTASSLKTPAGSVCSFSQVREVPGGYDIAASCTAEGPPTDDTLELRFAESARALLFESDVIADAGLVRCP